MKNWPSMDSTLTIFSKTNFSSWLRKFFNMSSIWLFEAKWGFFYINQQKCHLDRDSIENGRFRWKTKNPCLKNFSGVIGQKLALGEVEESQGFIEVKHSKYQNGFLTMDSLYRYLSRTIFNFQIGWVKTKIIVIWRFWSTTKLEVEGSQLVETEISKWVFSHAFPLSHRTHNIGPNRI
jgi:hypothetical protein